MSRIFNALIILLAAYAMLIRFGQIELKQPLSLNKPARRYMVAAYTLLAASVLLNGLGINNSEFPRLLLSLLAILAYCCTLTSLVLFIVGEETKRIARTVSSSLCAFLLLSILMHPLDWPLRSLAGKLSGQALSLMGNTVQMGLQHPEGAPPQLILRVNSTPFHVASECNGFGVILSALLISLILSIYRKLKLSHLSLNLCLGISMGLAFNTLRIIIIVLLAPSLMEHYHLMHEIVGMLTYWGCLALVWIWLKGPVSFEAKNATTL